MIDPIQEARDWLSAKETGNLNFLCTRLAKAVLAMAAELDAARSNDLRLRGLLYAANYWVNYWVNTGEGASFLVDAVRAIEYRDPVSK